MNVVCLRKKWIDLCHTKTKMISGQFHASSNTFYQWICFVVVIFVCINLEEPHATASTWLFICLLYNNERLAWWDWKLPGCAYPTQVLEPSTYWRLHSSLKEKKKVLRWPPFTVTYFLWTGLSGYRRQQQRALYSTAVNMKLLMDMPEMVDWLLFHCLLYDLETLCLYVWNKCLTAQ